MIRYCKIKHCIIGFDRPKICVPLVGRSEEEIIAQADQIRQSQRSSAIDMVELRGDYLDILPDYEVLDMEIRFFGDLASDRWNLRIQWHWLCK